MKPLHLAGRVFRQQSETLFSEFRPEPGPHGGVHYLWRADTVLLGFLYQPSAKDVRFTMEVVGSARRRVPLDRVEDDEFRTRLGRWKLTPNLPPGQPVQDVLERVCEVVDALPAVEDRRLAAIMPRAFARVAQAAAEREALETEAPEVTRARIEAQVADAMKHLSEYGAPAWRRFLAQAAPGVSWP